MFEIIRVHPWVHPRDILGWVKKKSDIEIVQIELRDLIGFSYDLSVRCRRNGIYFFILNILSS